MTATYDPFEWADGEAGDTPITAARLNAIEQGLEAASVPAPAPTWSTLSGKPATFPPTIGATAATAVAGNDPRLTNARTPTAHVHVEADVTGLAAKLADFESRIAALETP